MEGHDDFLPAQKVIPEGLRSTLQGAKSKSTLVITPGHRRRDALALHIDFVITLGLTPTEGCLLLLPSCLFSSVILYQHSWH